MYYRLIYKPTGKIAAARITLARSVWQKGVGLLGKLALDQNEGLWLPGVRSIHSLGMFFPIDVLFLDEEMRTTRALAKFGPGRVCLSPSSTRHCLELAAGTLTEEQTLILSAEWTIEEAI